MEAQLAGQEEKGGEGDALRGGARERGMGEWRNRWGGRRG